MDQTNHWTGARPRCIQEARQASLGRRRCRPSHLHYHWLRHDWSLLWHRHRYLR
jgi:hypothetical protein